MQYAFHFLTFFQQATILERGIQVYPAKATKITGKNNRRQRLTTFEIVGVAGNKKVNPQTGDSARYSTLQDAIDDYGGEASLLDVVRRAREEGVTLQEENIQKIIKAAILVINDYYAGKKKSADKDVKEAFDTLEKYGVLYDIWPEEGSGDTINDWLTAFSIASSSGGRIVAIPDNDPRNISNWYSFEGSYGIKVLKGRSGITVIEKENGAVVNENGRYWVAVGPKVFDESYPDTGKILAEEFEFGTELDIKIKNKTTGEISYIYAVAGDVRAHTYGKGGEGVVHNGIPYPNSWNAKNEGSAPADFASIEFIRTIASTNLNQYEIVEIIVYNKK